MTIVPLFSRLLPIGLLLSMSQVKAAAPTATFNATVAALIYGAPLLAFQKTLLHYSAAAPPNTIYHARSFVNATSQVVVESNVDTLYSFLAVDLTSSHLMISLPNITADQYYLLSFFDVYGDNFASLGNLVSPPTTGGQFLLRVASEASASPGKDSSTIVDGVFYEAVIDFPGSFGLLLIRWLPRNESSYNTIFGYQNQTTVTTIPRPASSSYVTLQDILSFQPSSRQNVDILKLTALIAPSNPPEVTSEEQTINTELVAAGLENGTYTPESGIDLTLANATATALAVGSLKLPGTTTTLNDDWTMINTSIIGDYKTTYGVRAFLGSTAYLAVAAPNAIYPFYGDSSINPPTITKNQSYLYTFSGKPPLENTGFWSLTAYNASGYLIDNPIDRYALGDRSNLTYSDGTPVYGNSSPADDEFQILVQAADVAPPANWTNNWLPAPAGGGTFKAMLRFYGPESDLLDATYQYPVVTTQAAITNSSSSLNGTGTGTGSGSGTSSAASPRTQWRAVSSASLLAIVAAVMNTVL